MHDLAILIDAQFMKSNTFDNALPMKYDAIGVQIVLSEKDITNKFPLKHSGNRYTNHKINIEFHTYKKYIKAKSPNNMRLLQYLKRSLT